MANATANDVRTWGIENGHNVGMTRGRLSKELIAAFNSEHKGSKYTGPAPKTVKVKAVREVEKNGKVRKVPFAKTVSPAAVREYGIAHGLAVPGRGRLSAAAKQAYAIHLVTGV